MDRDNDEQILRGSPTPTPSESTLIDTPNPIPVGGAHEHRIQSLIIAASYEPTSDLPSVDPAALGARPFFGHRTMDRDDDEQTLRRSQTPTPSENTLVATPSPITYEDRIRFISFVAFSDPAPDLRPVNHTAPGTRPFVRRRRDPGHPSCRRGLPRVLIPFAAAALPLGVVALSVTLVAYFRERVLPLIHMYS